MSLSDKRQATGNKETLWWLVACYVLLAVAGCGQPERPWGRLNQPSEAPDFALEHLGGGELALSDLRGRVVVMEFWATWCGPCRYSMPSLETVYRRYKDRDVTILLVNERESAETIRRWAGRRFTAPILLDADGAVGDRYGVAGIPHLVVVDQEGRIVHAHSGYGGGLEQSLGAFLDELLAEGSPVRDG